MVRVSRFPIQFLIGCLFACFGPLAYAGTIDFDRDIQPIISDHCYQCHGPDEKARKAKLRLDTKEGAFRVRNGKTVITPGKSGDSELVHRITSTDPDEKMPPPDANKQLTPAQIELLKK